MKKNLFKRALTLALCATTAFSIVGCGGGGGGADGDSSGTPDKPVDASKTQLTFTFFNSGYGDKWPYELAASFEEAVKDISFEDGKMGVQVHPKGEKVEVTAQSIKTGDYDVYFLEGPTDYNNMLATSAFEPLDSIVNEVSPFDGKKIVDKLTEQQQGFYNYNHATNGQHYYTLPHYAGNYSIIYNVDLFEEKGFYFAETADPDDGNRLVGPGRETKSAGPDGKKNTYDDGLPTTYEEFFYLCGEINAVGVDPVCFPGMYSGQHVTAVVDSLVAAYEGFEQANLSFTFNGTAKHLIKVNADGSPMLDGNGNPIFDNELVITEENGYELSRQAGYYYAFNFMEKLLGDTRYFNEEDGQNTAMTHKMMEQGFLEYGKLGVPESAMLLDGTWWQMDAAATFDRLTKEDAKWSKENRRFGLMPLPQPTAADAAQVASGAKKPVFTDVLGTACGVKTGLPKAKKDAALAFVQYTYSDQALAEFTYSTGAPIGVDYLDSIDMAKLNPWEKSVVEYMKSADILYSVSSTPRYAQNISFFRYTNKYKTSLGTIETAVWSNGYKAGDFFKAYQIQYKGLAWA